MFTTVINVRGRSYEALITDPDFVYVGRSVRYTKWRRSFWANPFSAKYHGRDKAMTLFRDMLYGTGHGKERFDRIHELRGKKLGCWCCDWDGVSEPAADCHAVLLARLANAYRETEAK